eukprot:PhM_4_TR15175/c2_g4_i1/m.66974
MMETPKSVRRFRDLSVTCKNCLLLCLSGLKSMGGPQKKRPAILRCFERFVVRGEVVVQWLRMLQQRNPAYSDIRLADHETVQELQRLRENLLESVETTDSRTRVADIVATDNVASSQQQSDGIDDVYIAETNALGICRDVPSMITSQISRALEPIHVVRENRPLNEFSQSRSLLLMSLPQLFMSHQLDGIDDKPLPRAVHRKMVLWYDVRFGHPQFSFAMYDQIQRHAICAGVSLSNQEFHDMNGQHVPKYRGATVGFPTQWDEHVKHAFNCARSTNIHQPHSFSCWKGNRAHCRFAMPAPLEETTGPSTIVLLKDGVEIHVEDASSEVLKERLPVKRIELIRPRPQLGNTIRIFDHRCDTMYCLGDKATFPSRLNGNHVQ